MAKDWFYENVKSAYEFGLVKGVSETRFNPSGTVTLAETVTLAARINSIYRTGKADFTESAVWYQPYVDYAVENSIINTEEYSDYNKAANRAQFAQIMASALDESALPAINTIEVIPDVSINEKHGSAVYLLYKAGILTGNDSYGTFTPDSSITRSAVATIVTRMADTSLRKAFTLADKPVPVASIAFSTASTSVKIGESVTLQASVSPSNATDKSITYLSSDPSVAPVNSTTGRVTALKKGTTIITATSTNGIKATTGVVVREASINDYVAPTVQEYMDGKYRTMPVVEVNSVGGAKVKWKAKYLGSKTVAYYTVTMTMKDPYGTVLKDEISGKTTINCKVQGPVKTGENLLIYNIIGYNNFCNMVQISNIKLEFTDGTSVSGDYSFLVRSFNPRYDGI